MKNFKTACVGVVAGALLLLGGTSLASANTISIGDGTSGSGPYDFVSNTTSPDSYLIASLSSTVAFSSVSSLSAVFNDITGGAEQGSPRIKLHASNGDFFLVYLGTPPSFADSTASLNAFSGTNLDNATSNSALGNSGTYQTLASLQAVYGADQIDFVGFYLDGGYASATGQHLTLDSLSLNGTNVLAAAAPVPEPVTLSLFGAGLAGAAVMRRRKKKSAV